MEALKSMTLNNRWSSGGTPVWLEVQNGAGGVCNIFCTAVCSKLKFSARLISRKSFRPIRRLNRRRSKWTMWHAAAVDIETMSPAR
jgi:hypothetical protein